MLSFNFFKKRLSIFSRMVILFISIIVLLYTFSIQINARAREEIRKEIIHSSGSKLRLVISSLEKSLTLSIRSQKNLINNWDLINLSTNIMQSPVYDQFWAVNNLQTRITEIKEQGQYIDEISIYIPAADKIISTHSISNFNKQEMSHLTSLTKETGYSFVVWKNQIYVNLLTPYSKVQVEDEAFPTFLISMKINKLEIEKVLDALSTYPKSGAALVGEEFKLNIFNNTEYSVMLQIREYLDDLKKNPGADNWGVFSIEGEKYIAIHEQSKELGTTLFVYIPEGQLLHSITVYNRWIWLITGFTLIVILFFSYSMNRMVAKPLQRLINAFKKLGKGELRVELKYKHDDEFGFLYNQFNEMTQKLNELIEKEYEQRIRAQSAELKQLQYQINPHFLYNSIFSIYRMAKMNECDGVMKLSQHLGNYYKYITRGSTDEIPLEKEIGHAKDYIEIQTIRFSNRIRVEFGEIPEHLSHIAVPRLILQPLIENAFEHGLRNATENGVVKVQFLVEKNILRIIVEDNGDTIDQEKLSSLMGSLEISEKSIECTGLLNVHRRLRIKYGNESGVYVSTGKMGGLRVEIRISCEEGAQSVQFAGSR